MRLLYGAFSIGDRPRVLRAQRRPASGPQPRQRRGELREMEPVVRHPGGQQVEPGQRAEPRVRDGVAKAVRRHAVEEREIGGPRSARVGSAARGTVSRYGSWYNRSVDLSAAKPGVAFPP